MITEASQAIRDSIRAHGSTPEQVTQVYALERGYASAQHIDVCASCRGTGVAQGIGLCFDCGGKGEP